MSDALDFAELRWCRGMIDLTDAFEPRYPLLCTPFLMRLCASCDLPLPQGFSPAGVATWRAGEVLCGQFDVSLCRFPWKRAGESGRSFCSQGLQHRQTDLDKSPLPCDNVCIKFRIFVLFAHMKDLSKEMPDHDALYQIAEEQAGYFSATQARQAGFSSSLLSYHLDGGRFDRVRPRIYRFVQFPAWPHEDLYVASLQAGPEAVITHDSALALYDLSDRLPDQVHVTIPRTGSRRRPELKLHTNRLEPEDVTRYEGLPVTTVSRTLVDVATAGLAEEQVRQAIHEALRRGLVSRENLLRRARAHGGRIKQLVEETLHEGDQR